MPFRTSRYVSIPDGGKMHESVMVTQGLAALLTCQLRFLVAGDESASRPRTMGSPKIPAGSGNGLSPRFRGVLIHEVIAGVFRSPLEKRHPDIAKELARRLLLERGISHGAKDLDIIDSRIHALFRTFDPRTIRVESWGVERELTAAIDGLVVNGRIDLLIGRDDSWKMVDFKTGGDGYDGVQDHLWKTQSRWHADRPVPTDDPWFGLITYALLASENSPKPLRIVLSLVRLATRTLDERRLESREVKDHRLVIMNAFEGARTALRNGVALAQRGPHCMDCPFKPLCPLWTGRDRKFSGPGGRA